MRVDLARPFLRPHGRAHHSTRHRRRTWYCRDRTAWVQDHRWSYHRSYINILMLQAEVNAILVMTSHCGNVHAVYPYLVSPFNGLYVYFWRLLAQWEVDAHMLLGMGQPIFVQCSTSVCVHGWKGILDMDTFSTKARGIPQQ